MDELKVIDKYILNNISNNRAEHIYSVANTCVNLSKIYDVDENMAFMAGILHDISKEKDYSWHEKKLGDKILKYDLVAKKPVWHAYTAHLVYEELNVFVSEEVKQAIMDHVEGNEHASDLSKILFIADFIEPNRTYEVCIRARKVINLPLDVAYATIVVVSYEYLQSNNIKVSNKGIDCYNKYKKIAISLEKL